LFGLFYFGGQYLSLNSELTLTRQALHQPESIISRQDQAEGRISGIKDRIKETFNSYSHKEKKINMTTTFKNSGIYSQEMKPKNP
jgi:hypothetical protein